jgi:hypothetical protein
MLSLNSNFIVLNKIVYKIHCIYLNKFNLDKLLMYNR